MRSDSWSGAQNSERAKSRASHVLVPEWLMVGGQKKKKNSKHSLKHHLLAYSILITSETFFPFDR